MITGRLATPTKVLCPLQCIILVIIGINKCSPSDRSRARSLAWQPLNERSKVVIRLDWATATGLQKSIQATVTGWYFSPSDMTYHLINSLPIRCRGVFTDLLLYVPPWLSIGCPIGDL